MAHSIRTFLLINLLLSVILITSLAIVGNLFLTHKEIQTNLDSELIIKALQLQALSSQDKPDPSNLNHIQQQLTAINIDKVNQHFGDSTSLKNRKIPYMSSTVVFQLWDKNNNIVLRSQDAPELSLLGPITGFSDIKYNDKTWRTYTLRSSDNHYNVVTAEHSDYRQHLENQLTQDSIFIMIITYPFLGFLIWVIVGKSLRPIQSVTRELKHRDTNYLEPVDLHHIPKEIEPLINELNSLFYRLQEAFNRHERFTSDAAHELRTPLAALSAQIQVALRADTTASRNEALLKVLGSVNRCTHLVQQLLTLSRMAPEAGIQNPARVKLAKQASDVAIMLAPDAIAKNTELELLTPDSPAEIIGNPTAISILMRNLVDNAIRYCPENSFIKIDIQETPNRTILTVTDNGPGIPKDLRERVFERFYRMMGTKASGTGLGLGIVLQITKLHKADIDLLEPDNHPGLVVKIAFPKIPE